MKSNQLTTQNHNRPIYTKILKDVCRSVSINGFQLSTILTARTENIREALKVDKQSAEVCRAQIEQMIHTVVVLYTSANFDKQERTTIDILISEGSNFIIKHFAMLSVAEIKQAFELSAAGKIDANLSAYHGKFTIQMLGDVLQKYWIFRMNAIARFDSKVDVLQNQQRKKDADERNERAKQEVIDLFKKLKDTYQQTGEFDETQVKSFHGKIVSDAGLITFSKKEKLQILNKHGGLLEGGKQGCNREKCQVILNDSTENTEK